MSLQDLLISMVEMSPQRLNWAYKNPTDYILGHGRSYTSAELADQERALLKKLNVREYQLNECYYNSQFIAVAFPEFTYVEGVAQHALGIPLPHAWVTVHGKVIDVTWGHLEESPILGVLPEGFEYYGVEIPTKDIWKNIRAHHTWQPVIDDYECRWPLLRGGNHLRPAAGP